MSYYMVGGIVFTAGVWYLWRRWSSTSFDSREFKVIRLIPETANNDLVKSAQDLLKSEWRGCIRIGRLHLGLKLIHFVAVPNLKTNNEFRVFGHVAIYLDPKSILPEVLLDRRNFNLRSIHWQMEKAGLDESLIDCPDNPIWKKHKMYFIRSLVVEKSWRGRGVGKSLLAACVFYAERHGSLMLTGECNPDMLQFYKKFGTQFTPVIQYQGYKARRKMKNSLLSAIKPKNKEQKVVCVKNDKTEGAGKDDSKLMGDILKLEKKENTLALADNSNVLEKTGGVLDKECKVTKECQSVAKKKSIVAVPPPDERPSVISINSNGVEQEVVEEIVFPKNVQLHSGDLSKEPTQSINEVGQFRKKSKSIKAVDNKKNMKKQKKNGNKKEMKTQKKKVDPWTPYVNPSGSQERVSYYNLRMEINNELRDLASRALRGVLLEFVEEV